MKYISTRGGDQSLTFEEAVITGLAPNGGLYIPQRIPQLPQNWRSEWPEYSFQQLAVVLLSLYIPTSEIPADDLRMLVQKSYASFRHPDVTPLKKLDDKTFVLELFHGPTYAFKDVALQLLGNLFEYFLLRRNAKKAPGEPLEELTVLGATSGDTGSAAIYGLRNKANIQICILYPHGRISPIQEAQMTTVTDPNVHNVAVKGTFDDCQDILKALFADAEFNGKHKLGAINSINWARILVQIVYYFLSYFQLLRSQPHSEDVELQYMVPTGNFGDGLAGYYAKRMGLPIGKLVLATNANDILSRFWGSGVYEKVAQGAQATLSPAMDILFPSNFERLMWYLAFETNGKDQVKAGEVLKGWMDTFKTEKRLVVPSEVLELAKKDFEAKSVTDAQTLEMIKLYFERSPPYIIDPHTAVGLKAAQIVSHTNDPSTVQITLATAHAAKFSEAVTLALSSYPSFDFNTVLPPEFVHMLQLPRRVALVEKPELQEVKRMLEDLLEGPK